jgi:ubiquinone/menaquinone biosynthesis C-methylase UbiE
MSQRIAAEGWQLQGSSAQAYEEYLGSAFRPWAEELVRLAEVGDGDRVLDVACGTGIVARSAGARVGARGKVVGIDLNEDMLGVARSSSPAVEWRVGNAAALPFADGAFEVAFCQQAIQFFSEPVQALREMRRVLTRRGRAAVSVCRGTDYCPTYAILAEALERRVGPEAGAMMRSPFSSWDLDAFRRLFLDAGFRNVRVRIEVVSLRYPSAAEFLRREAAASPLAGPIGGLTPSQRDELIEHLETALSGHRDDEGIVCPLETYVARADP